MFTPDTLTPSLRAFALKEPRAAVVTEEEIILDGRAITLREDKVQAVSKRGPKPYGRYALARALLATRGSFTQLELAERVRITQGAVAKALQHDLFADAIVQTRAGGVHVTDRGELFDRTLDSYPGPGGITTYWWKDTAPSLQAKDIIDADPAALRSGDVAADLTRARRRPEHAVVYAQQPVDPRDHGFATADSSDYTLMIIHAADPTIPATAKTWMAPSGWTRSSRLTTCAAPGPPETRRKPSRDCASTRSGAWMDSPANRPGGSRTAHLIATSATDDAAFEALIDLSGVIAGHDETAIIGGHMVTVLSAAFPAPGLVERRTQDADAPASRSNSPPRANSMTSCLRWDTPQSTGTATSRVRLSPSRSSTC